MARRKRRPVKALPLPEAVTGRPWDIQESYSTRSAGVYMPSSDGLAKNPNLRGRMVVPLGTDVRERLVRAHEMVHLKITPSDAHKWKGGLPENVVQLCEDCRVHSQMARLRFPMNAMEGIISDFEMNQMATQTQPTELAAVAASMYGTGEYTRLKEGVKRDRARLTVVEYGAHMAHKHMHNKVSLPDFGTTIEMAREIVEMLGNNEKAPPPGAAQPMQFEVEEDERQIKKTLPKITKRPNINVHGPEGEWLEMKLEEPNRVLRLPHTMRGRRKRVADVRGRRVHRVGRLYQDGRVFGNRPPLKGGSAVLIDTSGSMALTIQDVLALMQMFPAGIIAAYSSQHEEEPHTGMLRVLAKKGKRVRDEMIDPPGSGNGVDGPALDWLVKQPGPHYWVSDQGVYGGQAGLRYCLKVCMQHRVHTVKNVDELLGK